MPDVREASRIRSPAREAWRTFRRNRTSLPGLLVVCGMTLAVAFGPLIWTASTERINFQEAQEGPSREHPLGTDELGRDLLARTLDGGRVSLAVAFLATLVALVVGVTIGAIAGYCGSWSDGLLMRLTDMVLTLPVLPIMILCTALFAKDGTFRKRFVVICLVAAFMSWMTTARLMRSSILSLRGSDYVLAAQAAGASPRSVIGRHLLPNALSPVIIMAMLNIGIVIILESSLSFLGLGFQPPQASTLR